jgi:hypothetical protein
MHGPASIFWASLTPSSRKAAGLATALLERALALTEGRSPHAGAAFYLLGRLYGEAGRADRERELYGHAVAAGVWPGLGRIVASKTEAPDMFVNLV